MIERLYTNDFEKIYEIMKESFPPTEFRPYNEQLVLFDDSHYSVWGIKNSDKIISIAAIWEFDEIVFIEHLATSKQHRGNGVGASLLKGIVNSSNKIVCLEVEPPVDNLTRRRVAFYERNGFCFNSYPYIQPSITKGQTPIPLFIMTSKSKIDKQEFEKIKEILYKNVYKTSIIE